MVAGMVAEQIFVNKTLNDMKTQTYNLYEEILSQENVNTPTIVANAEKLDKYWKEREEILCLIINHKDIEKFGEQVTKVITCVTQNKKDEAEYEVELLKYYVEGYEHVMCASFQNIW